MPESCATRNISGLLSLKPGATPSCSLVAHQDLSLGALDIDLSATRYVLPTDDMGRIVGVVSSGRILERLHASNDRERKRWEGMPLGSLISVGFVSEVPETSVDIRADLNCTAITERDSLVGIAVEEDVFLSWQRLEPLLTAAVADPLTGLMGRLAYERRLNEEWARARRTGSSVGVVVADLNEFKAVNDQYGHQAGDEVLKTVADCLERALRSYDIVARYGGDEFVALCVGCDPGEIEIPIRRIQYALATTSIEFRGLQLAASVSLGAAVRHGGFEDSQPADLFAAADECLYSAKRAAGLAHFVEFGGRGDEQVRQLEEITGGEWQELESRIATRCSSTQEAGV